MFDSSDTKSSSEDDSGSENAGGREDKLQYTIKGIERQSVELMRHAAKSDGMKIGAWVSKRLREAAEASLSESPLTSLDSRKNLSRYQFGNESASSDQLIRNYEDMAKRIALLERDVERLYDSHRSLVNGLLSRRAALED